MNSEPVSYTSALSWAKIPGHCVSCALGKGIPLEVDKSG